MKPYYETECGKLYHGDALGVLKALPDRSVNCCVTSPPYWGLRDYGVDGQIGLESTVDGFVSKLVHIFREVRRVLVNDGTCWINLGDSYANGGRKTRDPGQSKIHPAFEGDTYKDGKRPDDPDGIKPKDLIGVPWRVAFALQADGWYLRQDIIWHKPNPMPESVTDRCTKSHEYIFLFSKSEHYQYDSHSIKEPTLPDSIARYERGRSCEHKWADGGPGNQTIAKSFGHMKKSGNKERKQRPNSPLSHNGNQAGSIPWEGNTRNKRSVWTVSTKPFSGAHFAVFPQELIEPCILAGCPHSGTVLDPFIGSGTTAIVANKHDRKFIGIELNQKYLDEIAIPRIDAETAQLKLFA